MAGKFDTFNDSAETAGKLNAILGSQLSATDLLMKKEDERIETVIRSMQAQGMAFKDMDRFTQKAIMQTLGLKDLNNAQKILGMDVRGFRNYQAKAAAAAAEQEEMEKKAKAAMDAMTKLKMAFANLTVFLVPLIQKFSKFAEFILNASDGSATLFGKILLGVVALKLFATFFGPILSMLFLFLPTSLQASAGMAGLGKAGLGASTGVLSFGIALKVVGVSMMLIGIAVALVILSLAALAYIFIMAGDNAIGAAVGILAVTVAIIGMAYAMTLLAGIATKLMLPVAGLTLVIAALVLTFYLAADATASAFKEINTFVKSSGNIGKLGLALIGLGAAFRDLNVSMAGGGLVQRAGAFFFGTGGGPKKTPLAQMAEDMKPIIENADSLATIFSGIEKVLKMSGGAKSNFFTDMAAGLTKVSSIIDSESKKGVEIQHTLENMALIKTGKSASSSGTGAVVKAISGMNSGMTVLLKLDPKQTKELLSKNAVEAIGKLV
jgi:hypothetical protein